MAHKGIEILKQAFLIYWVYYEVPQGQRDKVKRKFESLIRTQVALQRNKVIV